MTPAHVDGDEIYDDPPYVTEEAALLANRQALLAAEARESNLFPHVMWLFIVLSVVYVGYQIYKFFFDYFSDNSPKTGATANAVAQVAEPQLPLASFSSFQLGNNQQFRDPLTIATSFMANPNQFRGCCTYTNAVVQQALEQDGGGSWVKVQQFTFKIPLMCVTQPGVSWFRRCKQVVFKDLPELTKVGSGWLAVCTALESASFESLPKLQSVGWGWLLGHTGLKQVVFKDLPELTEVGECWLYRCTALESATFAQLPKLQSVGPLWLANCSRLEHLTLQGIRPSLSIGGGYLQGCTALQVKIPMLSATDLEMPSQTIPSSTAPGSIAPTFATAEDVVLLEHTNENSTLTAADLAQHLGAPSPHDPPPSSSDPTTVPTQSGESSSADPSATTTVCNDQQVGPRMRDNSVEV